MLTYSCPVFNDFYDLFYSQRVKEFPEGLTLTPFALAVWYLDDGSFANRFHPRISYGISDEGLYRACSALRRLGLKPTIHEEFAERKCVSIDFPGQSDKFFDLIREHVLDCMSRKLPQASTRRDKDRNARKLTSELAQELFENGLSAARIAKIYGVGLSTVYRRLKAQGGPKSMGRPPKKRITPRVARVALDNLDVKGWSGLPPEQQEEVVNEAADILRRSGFPFPERLSSERIREQFAKLQAKEARLVDGEIRPLSNLCNDVCSGFFPHRFDVSYYGRSTAYETWHTFSGLRRAIRYQLRLGLPVYPTRVRNAITMDTRTPTLFRPLIAKYLVQTYAKEGLWVWDPCAGYGGRMLGTLAAGHSYVGTDVDDKTVEGNKALSELLPVRSSVNVVKMPAQLFEPDQTLGLVFTSPPYFDAERYSDSELQSYRTSPDLDSWLDGFIGQIARTARHSLISGGCFILNLSDNRHRKVVDPIRSRIW